MYAVPYGSDYYVNGNTTRGYYGVDGNGHGGGVHEGGVSVAPQLPSFNAAFYQQKAMVMSARDHQHHDRRYPVVVNQQTGVHGHRMNGGIHNVVDGHSRWRGAVVKNEVGYTYDYDSNITNVVHHRPPMALLPTVPATALLRSDGGSGSAFHHPRMPASTPVRSSLEGSWTRQQLNNQHSVVLDPAILQYVQQKQQLHSGVVHNGISAPVANHCRIQGRTPRNDGNQGGQLSLTSTVQPNGASAGQSVRASKPHFPNDTPHSSIRSSKEEEVAETLANFSWSNKYANGGPCRTVDDACRVPVISQIAVQRPHQHPVSTKQQLVLPGSVANALEQNVRHTSQVLDQQMDQKVRQLSQIPNQQMDHKIRQLSQIPRHQYQRQQDHQHHHPQQPKPADTGPNHPSLRFVHDLANTASGMRAMTPGSLNLDSLLLQHLLGSTIGKHVLGQQALAQDLQQALVQERRQSLLQERQQPPVQERQPGLVLQQQQPVVVQEHQRSVMTQQQHQHQHQQPVTTQQQHQQYSVQQQHRPACADQPKEESYGNSVMSPTRPFHCQQPLRPSQAAPTISSSSSSALFQFVNEFIRQLDPNSCSVIQHGRQYSSHPNGTDVEGQLVNDTNRQIQTTLPHVIHQQHHTTPQVPLTVSQVSSVESFGQFPASGGASVSLSANHQSISKLQERISNPSNFGAFGMAESSNSGTAGVMETSNFGATGVYDPSNFGSIGVYDPSNFGTFGTVATGGGEVLPKINLDAVRPSQEVQEATGRRMESYSVQLDGRSGPVVQSNQVEHYHQSTPTSKKPTDPGSGIRHVTNGVSRSKFTSTLKMGKITKKSSVAAAMKIQKRLKKQMKTTARHSIISTISELKMPSVDDKDPLSLSTIGLLSYLAKNATLFGRFIRSQGKKKKTDNWTNSVNKYYDKLPTIFGPVAASLSLSNGATVKGLGIDTATVVPLKPQQHTPPSGPVFTNGKKHVYAKIPMAKQELVTPLSDRISLPDGTLESEESLKNRLENNIVQPVHKCGCVGEVNEDFEGPYYTHLAAAPSIEKMRMLLEERYSEQGPAIRIEKVRYTNKEGKTPDGCPIAKWVIRRSGPQEKVLCVVRQRPNHYCSTAVIAVIIVIWDGVQTQQADDLYGFLIKTLPEFGVTTNRRCETNEKRSCACQGMNERSGGASFSFGCSWSMYSNTCKYCKSRGDVRKFKLQPQAGAELESVLEEKCHKLADNVAPVFKKMAPACYRNQTYHSEKAQSCRLGYVSRGPFSGITACVDFCAHAHKDIHNMNNGCTVVVTLTKHRGFGKPNDEQLHVLPLCMLEPTDELGSHQSQWDKAQNGSIEILDSYPMHLRLRTKALPSCKERTKQQKQQRQGPTKSKYIRLDDQEKFETTSQNFPSSMNTNGWMMNGQCESYNGGLNRLPSVDTFSHFYSSRTPSTSVVPNGGYHHFDPMTAVSNGVMAYDTWPSNPSQSSYTTTQQQHDLARFTQGLNMPTSNNALPKLGHEDGSIYVAYTDNREAFDDPRVGGVAVALTHGSILLEVAKRELHATTALKTPDRRDPKRISLVFYQHKHLNYTHHGAEEHDRKTAEKNGFGVTSNGTVSPSDDELELFSSKKMVEDWPLLEPLKTSGDWKDVGAGNLCTTLMTDSLATASSGSCECQPTQKYQDHVLTPSLNGLVWTVKREECKSK